MGVDIDKARGHELAARVDLLAASACDLSNLADPAVLNSDIRFEQVATASVSDGAAADHEVWIGRHDVSPRIGCCGWAVSSAATRDCQPQGIELSNASGLRSRVDVFLANARTHTAESILGVQWQTFFAKRCPVVMGPGFRQDDCS
jgi:hypothetical protein